MILVPMKMHPFYTQNLWGGKLLKEKYHKHDAPEITAESWELSANKNGLSIVEGGLHSGKTLNQLFNQDNSIFGTSVKGASFPLLIKLIDANQDLSIQVHPSDETAIADNDEHGKEEVWYIVDCKPDSYIYFGFAQDTCRENVQKRIENGTICEILNKVPVKKGDVFLIKPGTLHAIGSGNLIAEIQQNSNTTFRVFDYNRRGSDGKLRELHIDRALDVLNYQKTEIAGKYNNECISPYFKVKIMEITVKTDFSCSSESFQHLLCTEGTLSIIFDNTEYEMKTGESYFIPAGMGNYSVKGRGKLIISSLPDR